MHISSTQLQQWASSMSIILNWQQKLIWQSDLVWLSVEMCCKWRLCINVTSSMCFKSCKTPLPHIALQWRSHSFSIYRRKDGFSGFKSINKNHGVNITTTLKWSEISNLRRDIERFLSRLSGWRSITEAAHNNANSEYPSNYSPSN